MYNKTFLLILVGILLILPLASAEQFTFKYNENNNFRFRCFDSNNNYCNSSTVLVISVEDPYGVNLYNNVSLTYNITYFNVSLPTNQLGIGYKGIISTNGTISEFSYDVTADGNPYEKIPYQLVILIFGYILLYIGLYLRNHDEKESKSVVTIIKNLASMLIMVMGIITLYPGYALINYSTLLGLAIGISSIGIGFYYLISDYFSEGKQEEYYAED